MMASELPPPGAVLRRDFRCGPTQVPARLDGAIKLLQWNIERGYQLAGIIEELRSIDADIISLQEVDVGCERSGGADTGVAIAQALGLNYAFLCEFEEEYSPLRDARSQGGGVHGNTILSKFDFLESAVVPHRSHPVDWNNPTHALARREPRRGERAVLRAVVDAPQGPLVVYSAHLEVFCGLLARITQLADIFADARLQADRGLHRQAILGDMNTMAHGIARLSPNYCCDHMRLRSIGMDEAAVWHRHVLPVLDLRYAAAPAGTAAAEAATGEPAGGAAAAPGAAGSPAAAGAEVAQAAAAAGAPAAGTAATVATSEEAAQAASRTPPAPGAAAAAAASEDMAQAAGAAAGELPLNHRLLRWGLSVRVARDATNPGFADPFPPTTTTLDNPAYRWFGLSLMKGKLDWVLLRRLRAVTTQVGNHSYALSDHKWLAAEVVPE